ncbi:MAG: hypothetical protein HFJ91_02255 [Muribaculaceae bacterium]|nr:hypothetical protein [Muribaculaceae bacterium]
MGRIREHRQHEEIFPFDDAPDTATIICSHVLEHNAPILYVSHDGDDGMWQFLCGRVHDTADAKLVSLRWVFDHDRSIGALKDMPPGYVAERDSVEGRWIIRRYVE